MGARSYMRLKLASVLMMLVVLATAAAEERKTGSYNGLIDLTCGDVGSGPALDINITGPSFQLEQGVEPPRIVIHFSQAPALGNGKVIKLKSSEASKCLKQGRCEFATSGELRIDRSDSDVTGHYELHFKNDKTISGAFKLRWGSTGDLACY